MLIIYSLLSLSVSGLAQSSYSSLSQLTTVTDEIQLHNETITFIPNGSIHCDPHPHIHQVRLPELCQIQHPNGTLVKSSYYNTAYCSNCLCNDNNGGCYEDRCCCRSLGVTNLTYMCPSYFNGESVLVSVIPTSCACLPCGDLQVSFVVHLLDGNQKPVSLANVTVDGVLSYQSDEQGYVGFFVPAAHVKVGLHIQAFLFKNFQRHYFVIPGQVNSLRIHLQSVRTVTLIPPQAPFIIRFMTLAIVMIRQPINFADLSVDELIKLMENLDSLDPHCGELFAYFPPKVFPINKEFTFISPIPRTLYDDVTLESLNVPFIVQRWDHVNDQFHSALLFALGWGELEIYDEEGQPFDPFLSISHDHCTIFVAFSQSLRRTQAGSDKLKLFAYDGDKKSFNVIKEKPYIYQNNASEIQWAVFPVYSTLTKLPLKLAIAHEEENECYVAVRSYDPLDLLLSNSTHSVTQVQTLARIGANSTSITDQLIFLNYGEIDSCVAVPCEGELYLQVVDNSELQMWYGMLIDDNLEHYDTYGVGPIYKSLRNCEAIGLVSETDSSKHLTLDLFPYYCMLAKRDEQVQQASFSILMSRTSYQETAGAVRLDKQEFCSVKVSVRMCSQTTTTMTFISGVDVMLRSVSSDELNNGEKGDEEQEEVFYDETEYESGDEGMYAQYTNCNNMYRVCFTFDCNSRVNLTVVNTLTSNPDAPNLYDNESLSSIGESMQHFSVLCLPHSSASSSDLNFAEEFDSGFLHNISPQDSAEFTFEGISGGKRGVFKSLNKEVAQQKCRESDLEDVGVYFDCAITD